MSTITLATLPQASAQEVFNQVANHLLTQNKKSERSRTIGEDGKTIHQKCLYKNNGLSCAAGCLMTDEEYKPEMDGDYNTWGMLVATGLVPDAHKDLISDLQEVHDSHDVENWDDELQQVAKLYNLEY